MLRDLPNLALDFLNKTAAPNLIAQYKTRIINKQTETQNCFPEIFKIRKNPITHFTSSLPKFILILHFYTFSFWRQNSPSDFNRCKLSHQSVLRVSANWQLYSILTPTLNALF